MTHTIGLGGGCHWCTEAYFQSLNGVEKVEQGWIASVPPDDAFSEAVLVRYDPGLIPLRVLIGIHLRTHASTRRHRFRDKYRSAVYVSDAEDAASCRAILDGFRPAFEEAIITEVLPLVQFRPNAETYQDYYRKNRDGAFCARYIHPKLQAMEVEYAEYFRRI